MGANHVSRAPKVGGPFHLYVAQGLFGTRSHLLEQPPDHLVSSLRTQAAVEACNLLVPHGLVGFPFRPRCYTRPGDSKRRWHAWSVRAGSQHSIASLDMCCPAHTRGPQAIGYSSPHLSTLRGSSGVTIPDRLGEFQEIRVSGERSKYRSESSADGKRPDLTRVQIGRCG